MEDGAGMKELDGLLKELLESNFHSEEVENRIDAEDDSEDGILQRILLSHQILGRKNEKKSTGGKRNGRTGNVQGVRD